MGEKGVGGEGERGGGGGGGREGRGERRSTVPLLVTHRWMVLNRECCSPHGVWQWPHCVLCCAEAGHSQPPVHHHTLDWSGQPGSLRTYMCV